MNNDSRYFWWALWIVFTFLSIVTGALWYAKNDLEKLAVIGYIVLFPVIRTIIWKQRGK